MSAVQITIFASLPRVLRHFLACYPLLALLVNFFLSGAILFFTGIGMIVGVANLAASVVFGIYIVIYKYQWKPLVKWSLRRWLFIKYPVVSVEAHSRPTGFLAGIL
ncbi:MAG: hypothetical protein KJ967_06320 [Elusimicrobia bacterium]|nr:hypothetical protein [Elusimicrobiota bacterium]